MGLEKETLVDLQEKYEKVRKLLDEDSKHDPENEPFLSKYAARQILTTMKSNLVNLIDNSVPNTSEHHRLVAMLSVVWLTMGTISIDTDEISTGEEQLMNCLKCSEGKELHPDVILNFLIALNQLGILWSQREEIQTSKEFLDKAEKYYIEFKESKATPTDILDLYKPVYDEQSFIDGTIALEKTHTLTLYYLAQIYGSLKDDLKSSIYCHITLKRQLESKDYEPIEWALNSATLSQFFMKKNGFKQARHHLAAASYILDRYEEDLQQTEETQEMLDAKKERLMHRGADVARCWAKYGLLLLNVSRDRLMAHTDDEQDHTCTLTADLAQLQLSEDSSVSQSDLTQLNFPLELSLYEDQVTYNFVLEFADAKEVFLNIQTWLNKAKEYFTLETHASDHISIIQDVSQMFKALAFFEEDEERQCKMLKRRADNLEAVVKVVNPTYYLLLCRQMWFELAEIYSDMLDIKLEKFNTSVAVPTAHALKKINSLAESSILNFNNFLDSLKDLSSKQIPEQISEELIKPMLIAYFHIGRLYGKIITPDKSAQLRNLRESYNAYYKLVTYCEKHERGAQLMAAELGVCQSLAQLLPLKILKLERIVGTVNVE